MNTQFCYALTRIEDQLKIGATIQGVRRGKDRKVALIGGNQVISCSGCFVELCFSGIECAIPPARKYSEFGTHFDELQKIAGRNCGSSSALDYCLLSGESFEVRYDTNEQQFVCCIHTHVLYYAEPATKVGSGSTLVLAILAALIAVPELDTA